MNKLDQHLLSNELPTGPQFHVLRTMIDGDTLYGSPHRHSGTLIGQTIHATIIRALARRQWIEHTGYHSWKVTPAGIDAVRRVYEDN